MEIQRSKIILKFVISLVLLILLISVINIRASEYSNIAINNEISTTNYKNTYTRFFTRFYSLIKVEKYEEAYNLLTDSCKKKTFSNKLNTFISKIKKYNFSEYTSEFVEVYNDNNNDVYVFNYKLNNSKSIKVSIFEYKPYECKIELELD